MLFNCRLFLEKVLISNFLLFFYKSFLKNSFWLHVIEKLLKNIGLQFVNFKLTLEFEKIRCAYFLNYTADIFQFLFPGLNLPLKLIYGIETGLLLLDIYKSCMF